VLADQLDKLLGSAALAHDRIAVSSEQAGESFAEQDVVLRDDDSDIGHGVHCTFLSKRMQFLRQSRTQDIRRICDGRSRFCAHPYHLLDRKKRSPAAS
jgi:hypothetical protein